MYDDLDPMFAPSAEAALEKVAVRVHELRVRRRVTIGATLAAVVVVTALTSTAFASSRHPGRVAVDNSVTTTTDSAATTETASSTTSTTDAATTTTTDTVTTTTDAIPSVGPTDTTATPSTGVATTTTMLPPPDLHFAFNQSKLVIQSGTEAMISYTITNDGDGPGTVDEPGCPLYQLEPDAPPLGWPMPASQVVQCMSLRFVTIPPHQSVTIKHTVAAGRYDGVPQATGIIPAPAGTTSFKVDGHVLPVTITAPAQLPFSTTFPAHITVASGAAYSQTFTLTNRLAFPVSYTLVGPCMTPTTGGACNAVPGAPLDRSWTSTFTVGANATVTVRLDMGATSNLEGPLFNNTPLPPGDYQLQGPGGLPLTLTVTP